MIRIGATMEIAMSCKRCKPIPAVRPCTACVIEHIKKARDAAKNIRRDRDRFRAYWHLAQAAAMASDHQIKETLLASRRDWQRSDLLPDWQSLVDAATTYKENTKWM